MARTTATGAPAKSVAKPAAKSTTAAAKPAIKPTVKPAAKSPGKSPAKPATAAPAKPNGAAAPSKPVAAPRAATKTPAQSAPVKPVDAKDKHRKPKLVRDSFTMPEAEYAVLGDVKKACLKDGIEVKKSELLRVGVALIRQMDTARLKEILAGLPTLKAGRPKKNK